MPAAFALAISIAALGVGATALHLAERHHARTPQFITRAQIGGGIADMNRVAQTRVRNALAAHGMSAKRITIFRSTADGSTGIVELHVDYGPKNGPSVGGADLTIILDRSVWSVEQMNTGLPPAAKG